MNKNDSMVIDVNTLKSRLANLTKKHENLKINYEIVSYNVKSAEEEIKELDQFYDKLILIYPHYQQLFEESKQFNQQMEKARHDNASLKQRLEVALKNNEELMKEIEAFKEKRMERKRKRLAKKEAQRKQTKPCQ